MPFPIIIETCRLNWKNP